MRLCTTCGRNINRGSTNPANRHSKRCLVCLVAEVMKDWRWKR